MKTQLLCTFTTKQRLNEVVVIIVTCNDVLYEKIYVFQNEDNVKELICTYNVDLEQGGVDYNAVENTISLHRKKHTNTLYTINALNELIKSINNGVLDTSFQVDWDRYRNCLLATNEDGLRQISTEVKEIVYIKVKKS